MSFRLKHGKERGCPAQEPETIYKLNSILTNGSDYSFTHLLNTYWMAIYSATDTRLVLWYKTEKETLPALKERGGLAGRVLGVLLDNSWVQQRIQQHPFLKRGWEQGLSPHQGPHLRWKVIPQQGQHPYDSPGCLSHRFSVLKGRQNDVVNGNHGGSRPALAPIWVI